MAKNGSTKNKMLKMIASGNKTLSDISRELDLAPSTVSQHLQELREMGAVQEVENEHVKKWKYYKLNPKFDYGSLGIESKMNDGLKEKIPSRVFFYAIGVALIATIAYFLVSGINANVQNGSFVQVRLTDPPIVPNDTQALYINYSSVTVHAVGNGIQEWVQSNSSGRVDLMSLINFSQIIAGVEIEHNLKVNLAQFNITSAEIVINGTSYNVLVPIGRISAKILGGQEINSSSEILVDLSPTVIAEYINGSTQFVMIPSVKAVVSKAHGAMMQNATSLQLGEKIKLSGREVENLYNSQSNLSIVGAALTVNKNSSTAVSLTVKNNGNSSVSLSNIVILGNRTQVTTLNFTCNDNAVPESSLASQWCRQIENLGLNTNANREVEGTSFSTLQRIAYSRGVEFIINQNGTLSLVEQKEGGIGEGYPYTPFNYTISPGATETFTFDGQLALPGNLEISLVPGAHYRIAVLGELTTHNLVNVTAS